MRTLLSIILWPVRKAIGLVLTVVLVILIFFISTEMSDGAMKHGAVWFCSIALISLIFVVPRINDAIFRTCTSCSGKGGYFSGWANENQRQTWNICQKCSAHKNKN